MAAKQRRLSPKRRARPQTGRGPVGGLARVTAALTSAAAIEGLHRLTWEIAAVAASRVKREYLLENELDQARRARGADLTPDEADEIERALARWEYTKERAARLRRTGSLPSEEMARLQERIDALLWTAEEHVERIWELTPEQVETVLLALYLAASVPQLREQHAKLAEKHTHALSALIEPDPATGEPRFAASRRLLRVMCNRLLGRPDGRKLGEVKPAKWVVRDWYNLIGEPIDERRSAADPAEPVSKREALEILKHRYGFLSEQAVVKYLQRQGVEVGVDRSYP